MAGGKDAGRQEAQEEHQRGVFINAVKEDMREFRRRCRRLAYMEADD